MKNFDFDFENDDNDDEIYDESINISDSIDLLELSELEGKNYLYDDFNIPEQILPISENDNNQLNDIKVYSEISGYGFEAIKLTCDLLNMLKDSKLTKNPQLQLPNTKLSKTMKILQSLQNGENIFLHYKLIKRNNYIMLCIHMLFIINQKHVDH